MIEVEIKSRVKNFEEIKNKLAEIGAKSMKSEEQTDAIFGHPSMLDGNNFVIEGGYSARVGQRGEKTTVEFKEILRGKGGIEVKSPIASIELGKKFLNRLGFKEAFTIHKFRDYFKLDGLEIALDKVDTLGNFIEIEKMVSSPDEIESARKECHELLDKLNINHEIVDKKYGDLMQEIINAKK